MSINKYLPWLFRNRNVFIFSKTNAMYSNFYLDSYLKVLFKLQFKHPMYVVVDKINYRISYCPDYNIYIIKNKFKYILACKISFSMNLQYKKIYICDHFTTTYQYFACKHNKQFWNFSKNTVNTRLESKLILAKCRKSLICLENTSHKIFQKKTLKMYLLLWKCAIFLRQLINVYILQRKQPSWRNQYFPYLHICNFYFVLKLKLTLIWRNFQVNCTIFTRIWDLDNLLNIWACQIFTFPIFMIHFDLN